jgi:hypothetical protein
MAKNPEISKVLDTTLTIECGVYSGALADRSVHTETVGLKGLEYA